MGSPVLNILTEILLQSTKFNVIPIPSKNLSISMISHFVDDILYSSNYTLAYDILNEFNGIHKTL
jgi:hypothetical protein